MVNMYSLSLLKQKKPYCKDSQLAEFNQNLLKFLSNFMFNNIIRFVCLLNYLTVKTLVNVI